MVSTKAKGAVQFTSLTESSQNYWLRSRERHLIKSRRTWMVGDCHLTAISFDSCIYTRLHPSFALHNLYWIQSIQIPSQRHSLDSTSFLRSALGIRVLLEVRKGGIQRDNSRVPKGLWDNENLPRCNWGNTKRHITGRPTQKFSATPAPGSNIFCNVHESIVKSRFLIIMRFRNCPSWASDSVPQISSASLNLRGMCTRLAGTAQVTIARWQVK